MGKRKKTNKRNAGDAHYGVHSVGDPKTLKLRDQGKRLYSLRT